MFRHWDSRLGVALKSEVALGLALELSKSQINSCKENLGAA